jgi:hypothetical protein
MAHVISRPIVALVALTGVLAAAASAAGVFLRGDLATQVFTTVRGDQVDVLRGGVYRFNGEAVAVEGVGWDAVTLFLVVPALLLLLPALRRGSSRARLATMGILVYFLYQYFEYATFLAYGPLFLLYVATFALSLTGVAVLAAGLDLGVIANGVTSGFPRRPMIAFGIFMAVLLGGLWLPLIASTFGAEQVPQLEGATTFVVQAFDLGLLVPLGLFTAVTVWRRLPVGYVLSAIVVIKGMAMGASIAAMMAVETVVTGESQVPPLILFAGIALVCAALAARVFGSLHDPVIERSAHPADPRMAHRFTV